MVEKGKRELVSHEDSKDRDEQQISFTTIIPDSEYKLEDLVKRVENLEKGMKQIIELLASDQVITLLSQK